jgi:hypothetical protein
METPIEILKRIAKTKTVPNKWDGSAFGFIKQMSSSTKGNIGEEFICELCMKFDDKVKRNPKARDSFDILILGKKVEVKVATEDTSNCFQFNGIRYHRKYDYVLALGIAPENIYFNVYEKGALATGIAGNLVTMEKGTTGSYKLTKKRTDLYDISDFRKVVIELIK